MHGNDYTSVLRSGESLCNRAVSCPTGEYTVVHQQDGNVVVYRNADAEAVWATGTNFQSAVEVGPRRVEPEQFGLRGSCCCARTASSWCWTRTATRCGPAARPAAAAPT